MNNHQPFTVTSFPIFSSSTSPMTKLSSIKSGSGIVDVTVISVSGLPTSFNELTTGTAPWAQLSVIQPAGSIKKINFIMMKLT